MRLLRIFVLLPVMACGPTKTQENNLNLSVRPSPLWDDGSIATITATATDEYGQPGTGSVSVTSTAGSLRNGLLLTLDPDGTAIGQLTCIAIEDPDCVGQLNVTATWLDADPAPTAQRTLLIHSTDALVSACAFSNRRDVAVVATAEPLLKLGLLDSPPETTTFGDAGIGTYDGPSNTGGFAVSIPTGFTDVTLEEQRVRALFGVTNSPLVQTFTTWDGYSAARSTFVLPDTRSLKDELDALATALTGLPSGLTANPVNGPFKAEMSVVLHGQDETAVVLALASTAGYSDAVGFRLDDLAGGSALAMSTDAPVDNCETFTVDGDHRPVDFMWVVDDSCSMLSSQVAVAAVGAAARKRIEASPVDFRSAGVSTGWFAPAYMGSFRDWTSNLAVMLSWFAASGPESFGTHGSGMEEGFAGLKTFIESATDGGRLPDGGTAPGLFREDSEVHVIFMSDTKDQSDITAGEMYDFLKAQFPRRRLVAHAIVCPEGKSCGDDPEDPVGKYHTLVRMTGGVLGDIQVFNPSEVTPAIAAEQAATMAAIVRSVVNGAGVSLRHRAITASVRVATSATVGVCNNSDIPRDVQNGWDLDPATGKLSFNGDCVPEPGSIAVVSYQSWARNGTMVHNQGDGVVSTLAPQPDAGDDAGTMGDAGVPDAGVGDAGCEDGGC
jgi:hypothetical protein